MKRPFCDTDRILDSKHHLGAIRKKFHGTVHFGTTKKKEKRKEIINDQLIKWDYNQKRKNKIRSYISVDKTWVLWHDIVMVLSIAKVYRQKLKKEEIWFDRFSYTYPFLESHMTVSLIVEGTKKAWRLTCTLGKYIQHPYIHGLFVTVDLTNAHPTMNRRTDFLSVR